MRLGEYNSFFSLFYVFVSNLHVVAKQNPLHIIVFISIQQYMTYATFSLWCKYADFVSIFGTIIYYTILFFLISFIQWMNLETGFHPNTIFLLKINIIVAPILVLCTTITRTIKVKRCQMIKELRLTLLVWFLIVQKLIQFCITGHPDEHTRGNP